MKLLLDQNLSPRLTTRLADAFPAIEHVAHLGLASATDDAVWTFAHDHGYAIVSKDAAFGDFLVLRGFPPHIVWIRRGNCSTDDIEWLLHHYRSDIEALCGGTDIGLLMLH